MYNLLRQCSEEKGWQAPTIETIQGNFRTLEYIAWLEKKLDYYKRLAEVTEEILEKVKLSGGAHVRRLIHGHHRYVEYQSIKQEGGK